jgi:transposase
MERFITSLSPDYQLDNCRIKDNVVVFEISSKLKEINCPYCGQPSSKVHSYYQREIQDLSMQSKKVVLLVKTRKMFCLNNACTRKTFSEKHTFVDAKGKKTNRLERNIIYTSTQLSSVNASKVLKSNSIDVCKSSICSLLKKNAINCG